MKLVPYCSNPPVKHANSVCVDFVPVQVKHSSERSFFSHARKNKNESYKENGIPMAFKILNNFLVIQNQ